jgi:threonine dehydrogenase-like Zn-dependent dehydrogenase
MLVEFGRGGWIEKARQQPDKVRMVLDKIRTDGLQPTFQSVVSKLDEPFPLGYCNVGRVTSVGSGVTGFQLEERVVSNGKHAEVVSVPINLCARIPDNVSDEEAAFTVLSAVALQGIRLAQPTLGETVVVTGLGMVGLLTVQLLRAHGCRVLGLDFDGDKLALAKQFGAEVVDLAAGQDPIDVASHYSRGRGADAVIIAAATQSSAPIHQAALMCRKRGRIVLVGVTGLELSRDDFFEKELTFQVSASYGPGRFDPNYEEKGQDYPIGFVRWTEQRNFEAVLDMISDGRLDVKPLISHRFDISEAEKAYDLVSASPPSLGILLQYPGLEVTPASCSVPIIPALHPSEKNSPRNNEGVGISFIGAGNYAKATLIPAFKALRAPLRLVASSTGVSGMHAGRKFGFEEATTDTSKLFADQATRAVVITTRHDTHACYVVQALRSGKDVFVEKPLCLSLKELAEIEDAYFEAGEGPTGPPVVMVGFNRRFAPQLTRIKQLLEGVSGAKSFVLTVNAGAVSSKHWTHDAACWWGKNSR